MDAVVVPFVVLVAALVVVGLMLTWALRASRRRKSPMEPDAARRGWSYRADDPDVHGPLGPATHIVSGRLRAPGREPGTGADELGVLAYEQYPAPGELYCVVELTRAGERLRPTGEVVALREAFLVSAEPRVAVEGERMVIIQDHRLTPEKLDAALDLARRRLGLSA